MTRRPFQLAILVLTALVSAAPEPALAGGSIHYGAVTFTISAFGDHPAVDLTGVSSDPTIDHLFHAGWWYRFGGETAETSFPAPDSEDYGYLGGTQARLAWTPLDPLARVEAVEYVALGLDNAGGDVHRAMSIRNLTQEPLAIDLFFYADVDVAGTATEASAWLHEWGTRRIVRIADASGQFGELIAEYTEMADAVHFRIDPYSQNLESILNDGQPNDFTDSGLPFPGGDLTGAFQYSLTIQPGETRFVYAAIAINSTWTCGYKSGLFCDGFEIGDDSLWRGAGD